VNLLINGIWFMKKKIPLLYLTSLYSVRTRGVLCKQVPSNL
jgi:hypothetical protein